MAKDEFTSRRMRCSFCGKTQDQVRRLVAGPNAYICNECIMLCHDIISDDIVSPVQAADKTRRYRCPAR